MGKLIYDLLIIGGGSAGLTAAEFAAKLGAKVAILERHKIGGDCTWTGCIPSKTLLKSAKIAHTLRTADEYGVKAVNPNVDLSAIMEHVRAVVNDIYREESPEVLRAKGIDVYFGNTEFINPNKLSVGDEIIEGKNIIISTGACVYIPPIQDIETVNYHTYETIWELEQLPERLLVLGAGMVGCEFSQAFQRLGAQVTLIETKERILHNIDLGAAQTLEEILIAEGVKIVKNTPINRVIHANDGIHLISDEKEFIGDVLLIATGRQPNVSEIGLEKANISLMPRESMSTITCARP